MPAFVQDFSGAVVVADIGGGYGELLMEIMTLTPGDWGREGESQTYGVYLDTAPWATASVARSAQRLGLQQLWQRLAVSCTAGMPADSSLLQWLKTLQLQATLDLWHG
jgi:hypothetical protein